MSARQILIAALVFFICVICQPSFAQHNSISYELTNEIGTYKLVSRTFSHELDNTEGITYVVRRQDGDTIYQINRFLNGWVALSNDGQTIAHLVAESDRVPLDRSVLTMYRAGKPFDSTQLDRLIFYELQLNRTRDRIPKSGWLRNDSIYHKMATHPFYVTEDKLFISFDNPKLAVFDLNQIRLIYTGNGANHFHQNYYSLPNAPYRTEFNSDEYFPNDFPKTEKGEVFADVLASVLKNKTAIPEEAKLRTEVEIKLNTDGTFDLRQAIIYKIATNQADEIESKRLQEFVENSKFETSLIPPGHPSWIFHQIFWLK